MQKPLVVIVSTTAHPRTGGKERLQRELGVCLAPFFDVEVLALTTSIASPHRLDQSLKLPPGFADFDDGPLRVRQLRISRLTRLFLLPMVLLVMPVSRRYAYKGLRLAVGRLYSLVVGRSLERELAGAKAVYIYDSSYLGLASAQAARRLGAKSIAVPLIHPRSYGDDALARLVYRSCDVVLALTDFEKARYEAFGAVAKTIPPPVPAAARRPERAPRPPVHLEEVPRVIFVGEARPYKGADLLVDAVTLLNERGVSVAGCLVGPATEAYTTDSSHGHGRVPEEILADLLDEATVLCLPSSYETFGLVVAEAWLAGLPCVVSDIPALREVASASNGAVIAERSAPSLASAIERLLSDPELRAKLARNGRAYVERELSPERVAERHKDVLETL